MKKRKLTNNISLKIMSAAAGILIWLIVVNVDNPVITRYYTISNVEVINQDYVDNTDKMCRLDEKQDAVRVSITGERKTLTRISTEDIKAVADLQQAVNIETTPVMVPITATCPGILPGNIKVSPQNLEVHLEKKLSQEFPVNVITGDGTPGRGYEVGYTTSSPEKVRITGPESLINKIDKVNAPIDINGSNMDKTVDVNLVIYDKNQEQITDAQMNNLKIENGGRVSVTVKLWKVNPNVKLVADYSGEPAEGYMIENITTVPDTISVAGSKEALDSLKQQNDTLWILGDYIDVSGEHKDIEKKVSLKEILPDDLKFTGTSDDIWVRVTILPIGSHSYSLATTDIVQHNKSDNLLYAYETDKIEIRVKAATGMIENLSQEKIKASIDLKDMKAGDYEIPVKIDLPEGYELLEDVTTEVRISEPSTVDEDMK